MSGVEQVFPSARKKMRIADTTTAAAALKNRDAFDFTDPQRSSRQQGIPHFYAFIPEPYHEYDEPPDYLCLHPKEALRVPIILDTDCNFRMIYIGYIVAATPYNDALCTGPFWPRYVDTPELRKFHPHDTHLTWNEHVDVEVIVRSQREQIMYGAPGHVTPPDQVTALVPIASVKGINDGMGMLRTEYLVPKGGELTVIFYARAAHPLAPRGYKVNGFVYGLKYYGNE